MLDAAKVGFEAMAEQGQKVEDDLEEGEGEEEKEEEGKEDEEPKEEN